MRNLRQTEALLRRSIAAAVIVNLLSPSIVLAADSRSDRAHEDAASRAYLQRVNHQNAAYHEWVDHEAANLSHYLPKRGLQDGPNEDFDLYIAPKKASYHPPQKTLEEIARTDETQKLFEHYYAHQGPAKRRGIFIESGRSWNGDGAWNELRWAGLEIKSLRDKFLDECVKAGIFNIRFGIGMETINPNRPQSIDSLVDFHKEAWKRGIALTDSVLFFSNLREFEVLNPDGSIDFDHSYYNHKDFISTVERRTEFAMSRIFKEEALFNKANSLLPKSQQKPVARTAVNKFNEPDTAVGFLFQFWNKTKGLWSHPDYMRWYPEMVVASSRATIRIAYAVERAKKKAVAFMGPHNPMDERVLYFHNEAMTPERYPTHQGDLRFVISQFILGDDQLLNADFDRLASEPLSSIQERFQANKAKGDINPVEAMILKYAEAPGHVQRGQVEQARQAIISMMRKLRDEHLTYQKVMGKTAKTDTMLMLDYYQQGEFLLPKPVPEIIKDLSANHGAQLRTAIGAATDVGFMNVLRTRVQQAEAATGAKLWPDVNSPDQIDFEKLLSAEDGVVLDKLIGLRNDYSLDNSPEFKERRDRAGFDPKMLNENDEHRLDHFLNSLLENNGLRLKQALGVPATTDLSAQLANQGLVAQPGLSLRDLLNVNERDVFHRLFGFKRERFLGFLPPHYARQIRAGLRDGVDKVMIPYVKQLKVYNIGFAELGGPYYPWAKMMLMQSTVALSTVARETGSYITSLHVGPAIGVPGWMGGPLTGTIATNGKRGEDGVFKLVRTAPKQFEYRLSAWANDTPWYLAYSREFDAGLQQAQERVNAANAMQPHLPAVRVQTSKAVVVHSQARVVRTCRDLFTY